MAMTLNELQSQLTGLDQYQQADEATLRQRAENIYKPQYQQDVQSLKESLNTQLATQARSALANGMQRSSYNQAAQASLRGAGLKAEGQLAANYEGSVAAALANMLDKEQDRKDNADQYRNNLLLQLYQLGQSGSSGGSPGTTPLTVNGKFANLVDGTTAGVSAFLKNLFGTNPLTVTTIAGNYTDEQKKAAQAASDAQRKAARNGTTANTSMPSPDSYTVTKNYNPYQFK